MPDAPRINRITPAAGSWFAPEEALAHLTKDDEWRWSGWLTVFRVTGESSTYVPERTRDRLAQAVATLTQDLLERPAYDELLHAHRVRLAPSRTLTHRMNLQGVQEELDEWQARVAHEERMLEIQEQLSAGGTWAEAGTVPRCRDSGQATTQGGKAFLIGNR